MVKVKIYAGIAVIVVFGVLSMLYVYSGLDEVVRHLTKLERIDAPFSIAAIEMEKNAGEYALGVLQYIVQPLADIRAETQKDSDDFVRYHASYMRLGKSERELELGHHLAEDYRRLKRIGTALMDKRDMLNAAFDHINGQLEQIDNIADHQMLPAAPNHEPVRSQTLAAIANIEAEAAEVGFWLSAFQLRRTEVAEQRVFEKLVELEDAIAAYRALPLDAQERELGETAEALRTRIETGIDELNSGEAAISSLVKEFTRLQVHMDAISDEEIEPLAAKGLTKPQQEADQTAVRVLTMLRYAVPGYILIALTVSGLLILSIVRPLKKLALGTKAIGAGDLEYRIAEHGKDEFDELARQFNRMVAQLQESTVSRALLEDSERKLRVTVSQLRKEISEHELSEREREKLRAKLRRSEAMAAMGSLIAGVAHEVRNPLFGISSTLDAMEISPAEGKVSGRYREVLRREVNRLNQLMTDLLEYGRPPTEEFTAGRLSKVIAEAVRVCRPAAQAAGVAIVNEAVAYNGMMQMNHGRLLQVFVNLIENAVQHTPAGTEVLITAERAPDEDGQSWVECRIKDCGVGFVPQELPLVFDPFFTRRSKGTGLGLAIVQRIVDEHKGSIVPCNGAEGGAIMILRLPVMAVAA
ncbi:HAMP domain-containing sensor histidine kinase [uncultured Castellaniella sp.]|uniref:sensor histidine kinase n=1 Tax=uncultured Castellaniella sp. TaxID=647907 RepID=UPI00260645C1|nr:HAMP domain-containing sensor histidine kinase [uncultured Castellaniella sp.]